MRTFFKANVTATNGSSFITINSSADDIAIVRPRALLEIVGAPRIVEIKRTYTNGVDETIELAEPWPFANITAEAISAPTAGDLVAAAKTLRDVAASVESILTGVVRESFEYKDQLFIATAGQTNFTLTEFEYVPGRDPSNIRIEVDGVHIMPVDVTEVSSTEFQIDAVAEGSQVYASSNTTIEVAALTALDFAELSEDWATKPRNVEVTPGNFSSLHWAGESEDQATLSFRWANEAEDVEVEPGLFSGFHWNAKTEASALSASESATLSSQWAQSPVDVEVEPGSFSSLHWAASSEGFSNQSEAWAITPEDVEVTPGNFSSLHGAAKSAQSADRSQAWAETLEGIEVEPGSFSSLHWKQKSKEWADAPLGAEIEPGKYSARHWAEQVDAAIQEVNPYAGVWQTGSYLAGDEVYHEPSRSSYVAKLNTSQEPDIDEVEAGTSDWRFKSRAAQFLDASFVVLNDTPNSYPAGSAGNVVKVNDTEDGVEFADDVDTTYTAGAGLTLTGTEFSLAAPTPTYTTTSVNKTVAKSETVLVDTATQTITAPSSPVNGDRFTVAVENFMDTVVAGNGANINRLAEPFTITKEYANVTFIYFNATIGWRTFI